MTDPFSTEVFKVLIWDRAASGHLLPGSNPQTHKRDSTSSNSAHLNHGADRHAQYMGDRSVRLSTASPGGWCTFSLSAPYRIVSGIDGKDSFTGGVKDKLSLATNCCQIVSLFTKNLLIFVILRSAFHENLLWTNFWKSEKSCSNQNLELTDRYLYCKCLYLTAALFSISMIAIPFSFSFCMIAIPFSFSFCMIAFSFSFSFCMIAFSFSFCMIAIPFSFSFCMIAISFSFSMIAFSFSFSMIAFSFSFSFSFSMIARATFVTFSSKVVTPRMVCAMLTNSFADMQTWCRLSGRCGWNLAVCTKHKIFAINKATATPRQSTGRRGMFLQDKFGRSRVVSLFFTRPGKLELCNTIIHAGFQASLAFRIAQTVQAIRQTKQAHQDVAKWNSYKKNCTKPFCKKP